MPEQVALLQDINPAAGDIFRERGFEVVQFPKDISSSELVNIASEVSVLGVRSGPELPTDVFEAGEKLQAVGCFCVGHGHVDGKAAAERGVPVFNSAFENTRSVAEYVVGAAFSLMRRLHEHSASLHQGTWTKTDENSHELLGKTVGVIGYGATGTQAASMLELLGMNVIYYDPNPKFPRQSRAERKDTMDEVLTAADVITVHVPGGRTVMTAEAIAKMKPGSFLINTSRGEAVDDKAVISALVSGQLAGFAGDVFTDEPKRRGEDFVHPLQEFSNALLTPHIAGSSIEAQRNIGIETAKRLLGYLATGSTLGSVNVGQIALEPVPRGMHRLLQFHRNEPGAAQAVDGVLADFRVNIERQRLETQNGVGYVATDVMFIPEAAVTVIESLDQTIRVKALFGDYA